MNRTTQIVSCAGCDLVLLECEDAMGREPAGGIFTRPDGGRRGTAVQ